MWRTASRPSDRRAARPTAALPGPEHAIDLIEGLA
jgi:hypothetical protein